LLTQRASAVNPLRCCCCCARVIQLAAEISIVGAKVLRGDRRREREREREKEEVRCRLDSGFRHRESVGPANLYMPYTWHYHPAVISRVLISL